jgi:iron complex outermembrane receptor protein
MRLITRCRLLAGTALLAPTLAFAQEATPGISITVTAPPIPAAAATPSNEQATEEARRIPGNVSIVPAERFLDRPGSTTLREMLDLTPGVFAQPKWGEDSRLSIRGSGLARNFHLRGVRLTLDGMPLNQADGSGDFQELDAQLLQRLEVFRGGNAFALGANTLGGALNGVSQTAQSNPSGTVRLEAGSHGFARGLLSYGATAGQADAFIAYSTLSQEGFRDHSAGRSQRVNGNVGYRWSDNAETRFYVTYNNIWQQIPGAVTRAQALRSPRTAASANLTGDYQRNIESLRLGSRTAVRPMEGVLLEAGISMVRRELDHPIFQYIDQRNDDVGAYARATLDGVVGGMDHRLVVGANAAIGVTDSNRYLNIGGRAGTRTASSLDRARTNDLYAESTLRVRPDVAIITGLQAGEAYRSSRDRFLTEAVTSADPFRDDSGSGHWQWLNPRFGALWDVTDQAQLFANLTWSTEPPTLSDLTPLVAVGGFSRLDAQRAVTAEVGTRGRQGDLSYEVTLYRSWIKDEIQLLAGPTAGTSLAQNVDRTIHQGIEAGADWLAARDSIAVGDTLRLRGAYTFSDFRFDGDRSFGDNELPGAPRHLLRAELRYAHPAGFWVAPNLDWVPQAFYADNANTLKTSSYALFGLRGGWDVGHGVTVFAEARNLGDTRYISSTSVATVANANSALFEPGFGRSAYAGVQFRF